MAFWLKILLVHICQMLIITFVLNTSAKFFANLEKIAENRKNNIDPWSSCPISSMSAKKLFRKKWIHEKSRVQSQ
jgi:hypothetical protein